MSRPNSRRNLDTAIERIADEGDALRLRRLMANAVVAQMLPEGAVKGESALKFRFGPSATRFSKDLDAARISDIKGYMEELQESLEVGWNGFTGVLVERRQAAPKGVPRPYVMRSFDVKLSYNGKSWMTVILEVGHNEIGDAEDPDMVVPEELSSVFVRLGFPPLEPMPLMRLPYQVAQKFHGLTEEKSSRAHDLVDLQVLVAGGDVDLAETGEICERLFRYRNLQAWPPTVVKGEDWDGLYAEASEGLRVLPTVDDAIVWANALIESIDSAKQR